MTQEYYDEFDPPNDNYQSDGSLDEFEMENGNMEDDYYNIVSGNKSVLRYDDETDISPKAEWKLIKIGDTKMRVSNEGKMFIIVEKKGWSRPFVTEGFRVIGSPYRYIDIEMTKDKYEQFYIHDIVWRAFSQELVPEGWEIRHLDYTPMDEGQCYSNNFEYLNLYKKTISREITVELCNTDAS